jgi:hypothetical protein
MLRRGYACEGAALEWQQKTLQTTQRCQHRTDERHARLIETSMALQVEKCQRYDRPQRLGQLLRGRCVRHAYRHLQTAQTKVCQRREQLAMHPLFPAFWVDADWRRITQLEAAETWQA